MFQKVLYYSGFIFSCYAFVFILWQNQAYKFQRFKFHAFFTYTFNPDHSVDIINVTDGYGSTYNFKYVYYKK